MTLTNSGTTSCRGRSKVQANTLAGKLAGVFLTKTQNITTNLLLFLYIPDMKSLLFYQ